MMRKMSSLFYILDKKRKETIFATVHRKVAILPCKTGLFESRFEKNKKETIPYGTIPFLLAETARFELAGDCSLTDFESAPL